MFFDDLLSFFLPEDFLKVLGFVGAGIGDEITGDEIDPLVMCNVSGGVETGEVEGGEIGWALFSGVELLCKASSMDEGGEDPILGLCGRTDSASAMLDFQES